MSGTTFFPPMVNYALEEVESLRDCDHCVGREIGMKLADELRHWEREWRAGRARLVPQVSAKPNGEGGL